MHWQEAYLVGMASTSGCGLRLGCAGFSLLGRHSDYGSWMFRLRDTLDSLEDREELEVIENSKRVLCGGKVLDAEAREMRSRSGRPALILPSLERWTVESPTKLSEQGSEIVNFQ